MLRKKQRLNILIIGGIIILILPLLIALFEVITTEKNAVVFLKGYHPVVSVTLLSIYVLLFILLASIGTYWLIKQIRATLTLRTEQQKMELLHLQSQVNPHFFFNMLNNLYGLVAKDAEKAQALILKLSDMMRYSIYDGQQPSVTLQQEVAYLQNYIELHKMRYHKKINVQFHTDIEDENSPIVPLLFIILLENAFKHGVENIQDGAFVNVSLIANQREIQCTVENNVDEESVANDQGIGLKNLKRRLELVYPNRHVLSLKKEEHTYSSQLILKHA